MWWRLAVEFAAALMIMLTISIALVAAIMLFVTAYYAYAVIALVLVILGGVLFVRLAPRMDKWVARHRTKSPLPEHIQVILFGALCLMGVVAMSFLAFNTVLEGKINLAPRASVRLYLYAQDYPIPFWLYVAFCLFLALVMLYGGFWCVRRWRQLSNTGLQRTPASGRR